MPCEATSPKRCAGRLVVERFALLFGTVVFVCPGVSDELVQVVDALRGGYSETETQNWRVEARVITVDTGSSARDVAGIIARAKQGGHTLTREQLAHLQSLAGDARVVRAVTNTFTQRFMLENEVTLIVREREGTIPAQHRILITDDEQMVCTTVVPKPSDTQMVPYLLGERRVPTFGGVPLFLSKSTLSKWIISADSATIGFGLSTSGDECRVVSFNGPPETPDAEFRLFLRKEDSLPLEVASYGHNGQMRSLTKLTFHDNARTSAFCQRAETSVFSGTNVVKESIWESLSAQSYEGSMIEDKESFFPAGTIVTDRRFSKPLLYVMGLRLPTDEELVAMLKSPRAVADYEAASRTEAQIAKPAPHANTGFRPGIVRAVLVLLLLGPSCVVILWLRRRSPGRIQTPR